MKFWILLALFWCAAVASRAAAPQRDLAVEAKIEQQLRQVDASLVPAFQQAREAFDRDDFAESARLLRTVLAKAPAFDPAMRRLGASLERLGNRKEGLEWAEKAVATNRSAANLGSLAYLLITGKKGEVARPDLVKAQSLLREARRLPDGEDAFTLLVATQVSLQLDALDDARSAIQILERIAPEQMGTHYFGAFVAASDGHWVKAEREMRRAQQLGLDRETAERFLDSGIHTRALAWWWIGAAAWTTGVWAAGLTLLCALGYILSRATLRQIERSDPNVPITPGESRLRRVYRVVLNIAGVYYYLSLPIIVVLVIAAAGGIIFGFLAAGWLPIKLTLLLIIGAIATIWSMGRSLFLRVPTEDPGRAVTREEAEDLWKLVEDVAETVNTRPVDEIRITPGTDLCVYERGSWREKMENKAKRILVLGAAVLNDFRQQDFRSVLAHEYGHFAHRDTAGGDVALRVRNDMWKFYLTMVRAGQATWLNLAFHFLRFYNFVFRRISHGATRLQEVLADRVAAQAYGPVAFESGLRHAIRRGLEFDALANVEIKGAIEAKRPIRNLYEPAAEKSATIEKEFEVAIARDTTDDDTHPAPKDRFRLISRVVTPAGEPAKGVVWDLFKDPAAIHREMMETVEKNVAGHRR